MSAMGSSFAGFTPLHGVESGGPAGYRRGVDIWVMAHQGGWDEIALVAGPLLLLWGLLVLANRRARRNAAERDDD